MPPTQPKGQKFYVDGVPINVIEDYILRNFGHKLQLSAPTRLWLSSGDVPSTQKFGEGAFAGTKATSRLGVTSFYAQSLKHPNLEPQIEDSHAPRIFKVGNQTWDGRQPKVMGILNITPDSFFDGGEFYKKDQWQGQITKMIAQGADMLDLGGESTRPGAEAVAPKEQIQRILPVLTWIKQNFDIPVSIDTRLSEVARPCLEKGADMINDVSALSEGAELISLVKEFNASYGLMHSQNKPKDMQEKPFYENCLLEVRNFLQKGLDTCISSGLGRDKILLDPGIGFGKTFEHNLDLLNFLGAFGSLGSLVLLGTSNKSFIGQALQKETKDRQNGSLATQVLGRIRGADLFRVHDVAATKEALQMTELYINP
ncbi:MAG: dihydropteroate synthase [SAR324 cluster bacterium]|nr:dihydropteroate synthase [SAR324 cluster bacterium]